MLRFAMVVLSLIGVAGIAFGAWAFLGLTRSAVQEIEALILVLIGTIGVGSAAVLAAAIRVSDHVERGFAEAALARRDRVRPGGAEQ